MCAVGMTGTGGENRGDGRKDFESSDEPSSTSFYSLFFKLELNMNMKGYIVHHDVSPMLSD